MFLKSKMFPSALEGSRKYWRSWNFFSHGILTRIPSYTVQVPSVKCSKTICSGKFLQLIKNRVVCIRSLIWAGSRITRFNFQNRCSKMSSHFLVLWRIFGTFWMWEKSIQNSTRKYHLEPSPSHSVNPEIWSLITSVEPPYNESFGSYFF